MESPRAKRYLGYAASNLVALVLMWITSYVVNGSDGSDEGFAITLIGSEFIVLPILMGLVCAYFWRELRLRAGTRIGYTLLNFCYALVVSFFFMKEGVICLIIVSSLILSFMLIGVFTGKLMFERQSNNNRLNVSIVAALLVILAADSLAPHDHQRVVADKLLIHATPEQIWPHVVAFEPIEQKADYWLFQVGMPKPIATTVESYALGAKRQCVFTDGIVFEEKIVTYEPNRNLTFDIVKQPEHPEIMGHIEIQKGQFLLEDNGDGTTTLIGNSWYRLYVFPSWYYDLWAESITRNVHLRVMEHIKWLSEKSAEA